MLHARRWCGPHSPVSLSDSRQAGCAGVVTALHPLPAAEALPRTGRAVLMDVDEWNGICPLDKQMLGHRLALAPENVASRESELVSSGPLFQPMRTVGNTATLLSFGRVGSGLVAKGSPLGSFAVAGPDKKIAWARARIAGGKVVVWNDQVLKPAVVCHAGADNPDGAKLYNREGLSASTFPTEPAK